MRHLIPLTVAGIVSVFTVLFGPAHDCPAGPHHCGYGRQPVARYYGYPRTNYYGHHGIYGASSWQYSSRFYGRSACFGPSWGGVSLHVSLGPSYVSRFVAGCVPVGYGWRSSGFGWGCGRPYGVSYSPRLNYVDYWLPPVYYPAELSYGPQAVKQFMGVDRNFALGPLAAAAPAAAGDVRPAVAPPAADAKPLLEVKPAVLVKRATPVSNTRTLALARRYVEFGDGRFRAQQYHEAAQRYKTAAATAPDLAESHIKHGLAIAHTGRYDAAVKSIARGLELDPAWPHRGVTLDDLYGDGRAAKLGQLEAFAHTVLKDEHNADAIYLLGVFLHLDGYPERAKKFLQRAAELTGDDEAVRPFTDPGDPAAKVASVRL